MPKMTGHKFIAETLHGYGVTSVFHVPYILDGALMEMEKLGIKRVRCHSEKAAAYMADGYARVSRKPGVAMAQYRRTPDGICAGPGHLPVMPGRSLPTCRTCWMRLASLRYYQQRPEPSGQAWQHSLNRDNSACRSAASGFLASVVDRSCRSRTGLSNIIPKRAVDYGTLVSLD